ncbi:hypothetical protein CROQUDRAFT_650674 [Cronartium quercuum f. sp. fusiforme G11]|uniref:ERCC4 domain-containing protein n=1 Tax=Cronartium quercuum f. sp. fusiforme G11 TaxID=708437 RepID=A0A9P6TH19_9BASI|nr:hypothetical protein CROQUDRAFT_650674 [Cronartium quercuum f. sp. fusiforme G11]
MISEPRGARSSLEIYENFGRSPSGSRGPTPCSSRQSQTKKRVAETEENGERTTTTQEKKAKASSSKLTQAEKDANKAANLLEKEKAKMAKKAAQEKEKADKREMKDANKLNNHRKDTVAEVTMHVPSAVTNLKTHPLTKAVEALRLRMNVEGGKMNQPVESEVEEEAVRWVRRRVKEWNEDKDEYVPCTPKLVTEPTVLVVWTANQLDGWVADGPRELLCRAEALRRSWPTEQIFILVHGLGALMRTAQTKSNAIVSNNIRAGLAASRGEPEAYTQRLKENGLPKNTEDKILREIERMKIATKCFVLRVEDKNDLANWMWEMTLEIGVRPYKSKKQDLKADLNLEVGGTKGKDAEDTYIKMLSSLVRVTENEAKGIVKSYPTLNKLYSAWDRLVNDGEQASAEQMLARCAKGKNVNGVASDRMLGKVTSKRIFDIMYQTKDGNVCANNM